MVIKNVLGDDIEITIDLGEETTINSIHTRYYNANGQWIYTPPQIEITLDNTHKVFPIKNTINNIVNGNYYLNSKSRYIKLKVKNYGIIPDGFQGAGNKAWTFIDEIIIN